MKRRKKLISEHVSAGFKNKVYDIGNNKLLVKWESQAHMDNSICLKEM